MKSIKIFILSLLAVAAGFTSCIKGDFDQPEPYVPYFDGTSNTTIAELKTSYSGGLDSIQTDKIIKGIVVGNDESGNIYKKLVIQDETAGIEILLNKTNLYNTYKLGQVVYVKCQGLYLGNYGGLVQLGANFGGKIGQINEIYIDDHLFRDSLPGPVPAAITINLADGANNAKYLDQLIKLENVHWLEVGQPIATQGGQSATNRTLVDAGNRQITVRTSDYCNFSTYTLPAGTGTVYGILTIFNSTYQLTVRDTKDIQGFEEGPSGNETTILDEPFTTGIGQFTTENVKGTQTWNHDASYKYMKVSGYQGGTNYENEDWLISPALDLTGATAAKWTFEHAIGPNIPVNMTTFHTAWVSSNYTSGDPNAATWTQVTIAYPSVKWTFDGSGDLNLSAFLGKPNVHVAFKYTCSTTESATWEVKNIKVMAVK